MILIIVLLLLVFPAKSFENYSQNFSQQNYPKPERFFDRQAIDKNIRIHDYHTNRFDQNDYVLVNTQDGQQVFVAKAKIPNYKPQLNMQLLQITPAPSNIRQLLGAKYATDSNYFANKFKNIFPEKVFHCVGNYRYPGFREYVKKLPGFQDFILSAGRQLQTGSDLYKKLAKTNNLQDFFALNNLYQTKVQELAQKAQIKQQADLRKDLSTKDFNEYGIKLLEQHGIANQFLYTGNLNQVTQLKQIAHFMNDTGEFKHQYYKTPELNEIANNATSFGVLANNANRENSLSMSQAFLDIGQNLLALGRGLVQGCERNMHGIYQLVRHPIDTVVGLGTLIKNVGTGIGNVATMISKNELGLLLNDQALIQSAQQDLDGYIDTGRQVYQYAKQTWQDKSNIERYEMAGSLMVDL